MKNFTISPKNFYLYSKTRRGRLNLLDSLVNIIVDYQPDAPERNSYEIGVFINVT